jgi:hypothetical protein
MVRQAALRAMETQLIPSSMTSNLSVIGNAREMHQIIRDEIYRIGLEAIRNACLHSRASRLEVELRYANGLALRVKDNGIGMDPVTQNDIDSGRFVIIVGFAPVRPAEFVILQITGQTKKKLALFSPPRVPNLQTHPCSLAGPIAEGGDDVARFVEGRRSDGGGQRSRPAERHGSET